MTATRAAEFVGGVLDKTCDTPGSVKFLGSGLCPISCSQGDTRHPR